MNRKRNIWRGLTTLTASLLTVSVAAATCSRQLSYRHRQISWYKEQCDGNRQYR